MDALGDLLPHVGLAAAAACLVTALVGRSRRWAIAATVAVFVLALFVPPPGEAAETARLGLHPFPVSFLTLLLAIVAFVAGSLIRLVALAVLAGARRLKRR